MNGVRSQFFAGAALAFDQHIGRRGRDLPDGIEHFVQSRRLTDNIFQPIAFIQLLPKRPIFLLHSTTLQGAGNQHFHLVEIQGFRDKIVSVKMSI